MKRRVYIFDNGGKTADRYTIIFSNGETYASSENPTHPQGVALYTGNIGDDYYRKTIGVNWDKNFTKQRANRIIRDQTFQQVEIARADSDWLGREVTSLYDLPDEVSNYIKRLMDEDQNNIKKVPA